MKINKIKSLCKDAKRIRICYDPKRKIQWISDGTAMYPLFKLPMLTAENIFTIFDIPEDKQGNIMFEEVDELPKSIDFDDYSPADADVTVEHINIVFEGRVLVPMRCQSGTLLVDKKYLSPFKNSVNFHERVREHGVSVITAHEGMLLNGVILPYTATQSLAEWLVNTGETLCLCNGKKILDREALEYSDEEE